MRRVGAPLLAVFCLAVFPLGAGACGAGAASGASGPSSGPESKAPVDRVITDSRITESSGLARSLLHPGVLWTHNDSGNPAKIFAIAPSGRTAAVLSVRTRYDTDWEAIATLRGRGGRAMIAIGDIGDNDANRGAVEILLVPEPARLGDATVVPTRVLRFRYPGGPRDAETLLAEPGTGRLYVVDKTLLGSTVYAVPQAQWPDRASGDSQFEIRQVAAADADLVTDGTFLPDGQMLLRGYGSVSLLPSPDSSHGRTIRALAVRRLPFQDQGESITLTGDGRQALIGSEGRREPVLRVPIPLAGTDPTTEFGADPTATTSPATTRGRGPAESGSARAGADVSYPVRVLAIGAGAGIALLGLLAAAAFSLLRRH